MHAARFVWDGEQVVVDTRAVTGDAVDGGAGAAGAAPGEAVLRLLRDPGLAPMVALLRDVLEREDGEARGRIPLRSLDEPARGALARLLGSARTPSASAWVGLREIDAVLQAAPAGAPLVACLAAIGGPLRHRRAERRDAAAARHAMWAEAAARQPRGGRPGPRTMAHRPA